MSIYIHSFIHTYTYVDEYVEREREKKTIITLGQGWITIFFGHGIQVGFYINKTGV